ncbi:aldehyde dehydrogenase [Balneola sp. MJW-20]|uniref:aldehyde dehydrogenase n=1 Tax=Gracilimonas aurantiaca TaxID=3234185 RepID=UPI0034ACACDD
MFEQLFRDQKKFYKSGSTRPYGFRQSQLKALYRLLDEQEERLLKAVFDDFKKPAFETFALEIGVLKSELSYALNNLSKWMQPENIRGTLVNFPSKNVIYKEPLGTVLIISPWNYPVQLSLLPLIGAIAAGNTAIIKPSECTPNTSSLLAELIAEYFSEDYISVVQGGVEETQSLLHFPFDHIFFTGSPRVGKIIMKAAAEHLSPVTLELGGKSPCIITKDADLDISARRIVWGKFVNAGQTCVASDYVYVPDEYKTPFIHACNSVLREFYGENPKESSDYARIINDQQFNRLQRILETDDQYIVTGGVMDADERYISPTILDIPDWEVECMKDEIFGPVLPVIGYEDLNEIIEVINEHPKPLACYIFTNDHQAESRILEEISFGGGAVNDTVAHLGNHHLPFGGVGNSGMGTYHGVHSFNTFSHRKSIMKKSSWLKIPIRYAPYNGNLKWIKRILR